MTKASLYKSIRLWLALALWVAAMLVQLLAHALERNQNLTWYVVALIVLPWHALLAVVLAKHFPRRLQALWIIPAIICFFALGCWLMLLALFSPLKWESVNDALTLNSGGREAYWIALFTLPFSLVPILLYVCWPRPAPRPVYAPICSQCGYNLQGSAASDRCPECGKPIVLGIDAPMPLIH